MSDQRRRTRPPGEEGRDGLTGGGPSQLGVIGSMRARDVSKPTVADAAAAEKLVQVSYRPRARPRPAPPAQADDGGSGGSSPEAS